MNARKIVITHPEFDDLIADIDPEPYWDVPIRGSADKWKKRQTDENVYKPAIAWWMQAPSPLHEYEVDSEGIEEIDRKFAAYIVCQAGWCRGMVVQFWNGSAMAKEVTVNRLRAIVPERGEDGVVAARIWWNPDDARKTPSV